MNQPLVSVIIPAYNKADYTRRVVESVLAQTYQPLEIIVVDDGSTDQTPQVMALFKEKIRYIKKANGGACSARNEGIREAKGKFLAFLDCDDLYDSRKIELSVAYLQANPSRGFVHTAAEFIDANDHVVGQYDHPKSHRGSVTSKGLLLGNHICNSTVVVRREILDQSGLFDESIFTPGDWDMWIRLSLVSPGGYIPKTLTKYRVIDNYVFNRLEQAAQEELYVIEKYFSKNPVGFLLRRRILSNYYLRFSFCYFIKDQYSQFWQNLMTALEQYPFNLKIWGVGIVAVLMPNRLKDILYVRIVRRKDK